tara:strand:- start:22405 stop:22971 length:567 start_codon:yes stop_codon:yes gene_type:complete
MNMFQNGYYSSEELSDVGFKELGDNVKIAKNCIIIGPENISIGSNVQIDGGVYIIAATGYMEIGNHIHISANCYFSCSGGIILKDYCGLASRVTIYSSSDDYTGEYLTNPTVPQEFRKLYPELVTLGEHVIIGTGTAVLPGSNIGQGCSVGAMSLVTRNLEEWGVYFGSPAKRIKNRKKDLLKYCQNG